MISKKSDQMNGKAASNQIGIWNDGEDKDFLYDRKYL